MTVYELYLHLDVLIKQGQADKSVIISLDEGVEDVSINSNPNSVEIIEYDEG